MTVLSPNTADSLAAQRYPRHGRPRLGISPCSPFYRRVLEVHREHGGPRMLSVAWSIVNVDRIERLAGKYWCLDLACALGCS